MTMRRAAPLVNIAVCVGEVDHVRRWRAQTTPCRVVRSVKHGLTGVGLFVVGGTIDAVHHVAAGELLLLAPRLAS